MNLRGYWCGTFLVGCLLAAGGPARADKSAPAVRSAAGCDWKMSAWAVILPKERFSFSEGVWEDVLLVKKSRDGVKITGVRTGGGWTGKVKDDRFEIPFEFYDQKRERMERGFLSGTCKGREVTWDIRTVDGVLDLVSSRLEAFWVCSGHGGKSHTAQNGEEMRRLSKEFGCVGWHLVK